MNVFITGGSRGIGRGLVLAALSQGHNVAFTFNTKTPEIDAFLAKAATQFPAQRCRAYQLNITDSDQVDHVVETVISEFESIEVVINNAGINQNNLIFNMSNDEWHTVINTNLSGVFYVTRAFLPRFLAQKKGRFISISSLAKEGATGQANYAASKAGLTGLSGTIAKEYGPKGITSNVVLPSIIDSDMTKENLSKDLEFFWTKYCPLKRKCELDEFTAVVMFLASPESKYINGQVISVTGGMDWAP